MRWIAAAIKYAVGQVDLERYDDQNFQYIFSPEWSVIDTLPSSIFQGIPGLDMSMRLSDTIALI